jgi:two-component system, sensor histidine kinase and response regulator
MENSRRHTILIVDDTPENIYVLGEILRRDYRVKFASNGRKALEIMQSDSPPDLILLDVMMPGMDGFEICRSIKAMEDLKDTPVVFISAMGDPVKKVDAFACGGVDYVARPFWPEEVMARVATHLQLRDQKRELARQLERLRNLESLRDDLVHMVVHDMRSPIGYLVGSLEMLIEDGEGVFESDQMETLRESMACAESLGGIAQSLLDVSMLESGRMPMKMERCDLVKIVSEVAENPGYPFWDRKARFAKHPATVTLECDPDLIRRVLLNLVGNALKFTPEDGDVEVELSQEPGFATVSVKDTGEGIPEEFQDEIFQKFVTKHSAVCTRKYCSTGLGLAFCKLAVEAHGGKIGVKSQLGVGSCFTFSLPLSRRVEQGF